MKKLSLYSMTLAALFFLASCGGSTADKKTTNETHENHEHESHEGHDHAEMEEQANANAFKEAAAEAKVFFANLEDGAEVSSPVKIEFGVEGIDIKPAGEVVEGTGHHHIIVDGEGIEAGGVVPADETHIHYGQGQTETELELSPGEHQLTLQFADGFHRSYGPSLSATITITVVE